MRMCYLNGKTDCEAFNPAMFVDICGKNIVTEQLPLKMQAFT